MPKINEKGITQQDLLNQRESIQQDLLTLLDGLDQDILDNACDIVVDRFRILIDKLGKDDPQ